MDQLTKQLTLIKAPSVLGLRPSGVEQLPEALERAGLTKKLTFMRTETVTPPSYSSQRDPRTNMLNPEAIAHYSVNLADAVERARHDGAFPLVLGGDCSIILGNMLALRRAGRFGLFFLDGHADFYQPKASQTGEAADMDLALATGHGPSVVTNIEGRRPFVREEDVVQFGQRDRQETLDEGSQQIADTHVHVFELEQIRKEGVEQSCQKAIDTLLAQPIEGFWVHIDADVINDNEMPAVDYRLPGGLAFAELTTVLDKLFATGKVAGLSLAIYNPKLDPGQHLAPKLVDLLVKALK